MKKGISIWSFPAGTLLDSFKLASDAGFEGVEVALDENAGEITLHSTEKELLAIRQQADDCGIQLYSVASGLYWSYFLNDADESVRCKAQDIVKKQLEVASILGCQSILVIPGCVKPVCGPMTWIIPLRSEPIGKIFIPFSAQLLSSVATCCADCGSAMGRCWFFVGMLWSGLAVTCAGRNTPIPRLRSPAKACGLVTSWIY